MSDSPSNTSSPGRRLREAMVRGLAVLPGAFNALSAKAIERVGFDGVYISGAALSNAVHGLPDVGLTTLTEAVAHARTIASAVRCPTLADADTGFGESINAVRTVREFERAGVAGIHLEDQRLPKRCGHLAGKELIEPSAMVEKIRAAAAARSDPSFVVIARVDSRGVHGFDDAIDRAQRYADAGADAIFPEALQNEAEFARFAQAIDIPLMANMTEFGRSPLLSADTLRQMGYRIVIYPMTLLRVSMKAIDECLAELRRAGTQSAWLPQMQTRQELYDLLDYNAGDLPEPNA